MIHANVGGFRGAFDGDDSQGTLDRATAFISLQAIEEDLFDLVEEQPALIAGYIQGFISAVGSSDGFSMEQFWHEAGFFGSHPDTIDPHGEEIGTMAGKAYLKDPEFRPDAIVGLLRQNLPGDT